MHSDWRQPDFAWPAPAKLNLFLHITGRRDDGYHLLQTVFQFVEFSDQLFFALRDDGQICRTSDLPGVEPEADLVVRAAKALQTVSGCTLGVDVRVEKHLPMGGGIGGGSSDAATVLVALNRLWNVSLSTDELAKIGAQLGADVPVFVRGKAAWAEGVGEILTPISPPEPWYVILMPDVNVNTGKVFSDPELTRDLQAITIRDFLSGHGGNVCQKVVVKHYPKVAQAIDWLSHFAPAKMTGTGACVFAAFEREEQAKAVTEALPSGWRGVVAKGANSSPLYRALNE